MLRSSGHPRGLKLTLNRRGGGDGVPAGPAAGPAVLHFATHEPLLYESSRLYCVVFVLCACLVCHVCRVCVQRLYLAFALALVSVFVAFCFHCAAF